jgi:carbonic anhydrase
MKKISIVLSLILVGLYLTSTVFAEEQVDKFSHTMHHPNNRPIQPVNACIILR